MPVRSKKTPSKAKKPSRPGSAKAKSAKAKAKPAKAGSASKAAKAGKSKGRAGAANRATGRGARPTRGGKAPSRMAVLKQQVIAPPPPPLEPAPAPTEPNPAHDKALVAAKAALSKKAEDVLLLNVRSLTSITDYYVIASGNGPRQVTAVAEAVEEEMKKGGFQQLSNEGKGAGHWVLLDYGDVVIHVFEPEVRASYDLEGNWMDAPRERVEG